MAPLSEGVFQGALRRRDLCFGCLQLGGLVPCQPAPDWLWLFSLYRLRLQMITSHLVCLNSAFYYGWKNHVHPKWDVVPTACSGGWGASRGHTLLLLKNLLMGRLDGRCLEQPKGWRSIKAPSSPSPTQLGSPAPWALPWQSPLDCAQESLGPRWTGRPGSHLLVCSALSTSGAPWDEGLKRVSTSLFPARGFPEPDNLATWMSSARGTGGQGRVHCTRTAAITVPHPITLPFLSFLSILSLCEHSCPFPNNFGPLMNVPSAHWTPFMWILWSGYNTVMVQRERRSGKHRPTPAERGVCCIWWQTGVEEVSMQMVGSNALRANSSFP